MKVRGKIVIDNGRKIFVPVGDEVSAEEQTTSTGTTPATPVVRRETYTQPLPEGTIIRRPLSARPEVLKDVRYFDGEQLWHKSIIEFFKTDPGDDSRKTYDEANLKMDMRITGLKFGFKPNVWKLGYSSQGYDSQFFYDFYDTLKNGKMSLIINRDEVAEFPLDMFLGELNISPVVVPTATGSQQLDIVTVQESRPIALKDTIGKDLIYVTEKDKVFIRVRLGADGLPDPVADYCLQCNVDQMPTDCEGITTACPYADDIVLEAAIIARVTRAKIA